MNDEQKPGSPEFKAMADRLLKHRHTPELRPQWRRIMGENKQRAVFPLATWGVVDMILDETGLVPRAAISSENKNNTVILDGLSIIDLAGALMDLLHQSELQHIRHQMSNEPQNRSVQGTKSGETFGQGQPSLRSFYQKDSENRG